MSEASFVRIFQPADMSQAAQARLALGAAGIPFIIENEQYMNAVGMPYSIGAQRIYVQVPVDYADDAREVLDDWFGPPEAPAQPVVERPGGTGVVRTIAAPFLFLLGLFGFAELAIALGRRLSNRQAEEQASE